MRWHAVDKIRRSVVRDGIVDRVDKSTLMQLLYRVNNTHISVFLTYSYFFFFHYVVCVLNANALCERTDIRDIIFVNSNCKTLCVCVLYDEHTREPKRA